MCGILTFRRIYDIKGWGEEFRKLLNINKEGLEKPGDKHKQDID